MKKRGVTNEYYGKRPDMIRLINLTVCPDPIDYIFEGGIFDE